jgi:C-terminal processing protease CtpA/Prc
VNVDTYVSRTGSGLRGLRVVNVAPEISARYGLQSNDLILSVNGEPVSTKADAIAVGKRQYNRGVRTFVVRLLSDGREVERVVEAPNR